MESFRRAVWEHWKKHGRHALPWRKTKDPYRILVSEVMLQQTQVSRVIEKYKEFLKAFPTVGALAEARLADVLKVWSGLGYNRRAKYLHDAARFITSHHGGAFPREYPTLRAIPGIGEYTANAVRVFAFNESEVLLETNVRTAIIHHFFPRRRTVRDTEVEKLAAAAAMSQDPRRWHSALFDYGAHLKKMHGNPGRKSAHYGVQSKFDGSLRQVRGAILKLLTTGAHGDMALAQKLSFDESRVREALAGLARDGLVVAERGSWRIA